MGTSMKTPQAPREYLEAKYGDVLTLEEVMRKFEIRTETKSFAVLKDKATGEVGHCDKQEEPLFYFGFR